MADGSVDLFGKFTIRHSASSEIPAQFIIRHSASSEIPAQFEVGQGSEELRSLVLISGIGYIVRGENAF